MKAYLNTLKEAALGILGSLVFTVCVVPFAAPAVLVAVLMPNEWYTWVLFFVLMFIGVGTFVHLFAKFLESDR